MTVAPDDLLLFVPASPQREDMKIVQLRLWLGSGPSVGAVTSGVGSRAAGKAPKPWSSDASLASCALSTSRECLG